MTQPKMHTARGRLTRYALSCGYVERFERGDQRVELSLEHGVYHIRGFGYSYGFRQPHDQRVNALYHFGYSRRTLTEARYCFDLARIKIKQVDPPTSLVQDA